MEIREFTMDDYDCVRQLWEVQGVRLEPGDSEEAIARKRECEPDLFLVAENKGVILGVIIGSCDGRMGWISRQAVHRTSRRMGIGSKLVEEVERRLKSKGVQQVALLVNRSDLEAQDFYQQRGFEVEEEQLLMTKRL